MSTTVLIVEDEILLRMEAAEHGDEALSILKTLDNVALVISDVRMPGRTDGSALVAWVQQERPHIKTILVSGHLSRQSMLSLADGAFEKPVNMDLLVRRVNRMLVGSPS